MDIRLIAFDLDGSALNSEKVLSPRTVAAFESALRAGKALVPATGRSLSWIPKPLMDLGLPYLILNNGSTVVSLPEERPVLSHVFDREVSRSLLSLFKTLPCMIFATGPEYSVLDAGVYDSHDPGIQALFNRRMRLWKPVIADVGEWLGKEPEDGPWDETPGSFIPLGINKFSLIFADGDEWQKNFALLRNREGVSASSSDRENIEVMPPGVNKGNALRFVAEKLGIEMGHVMAIGDNHNDMEMIRDAGYGVAMGNGVESLKQLARRVTLSCDEDGAAAAIEAVLSER